MGVLHCYCICTKHPSVSHIQRTTGLCSKYVGVTEYTEITVTKFCLSYLKLQSFGVRCISSPWTFIRVRRVGVGILGRGV